MERPKFKDIKLHFLTSVYFKKKTTKTFKQTTKGQN